MRKNKIISTAIVALSVVACMGLAACSGSSTASSSASTSTASSSSSSMTDAAKSAAETEAALQSKAVSNSDVVGTWKLTDGTDAKGNALDFALFEKANMANTLTIGSDGRFAFDLYEEEIPGAWSIENDQLKLKVDEGDTIEVKYVDSNLHLSIDGEQLIFSKSA